ncbi:hypothetical protein ACFLXI_05150 [Chloroflexota bacterium]
MSKKAPDKIWLQFEEWEFDCPTWCSDKINDSDNEYIRIDLYEALETENKRLREALKEEDHG